MQLYKRALAVYLRACAVRVGPLLGRNRKAERGQQNITSARKKRNRPESGGVERGRRGPRYGQRWRGVSQSQQRRHTHNQLKVDRRVTQPCRECTSDPLDAMDMMEEASRMLAEEEMAAFQKMKLVVDSGRRREKVCGSQFLSLLKQLFPH